MNRVAAFFLAFLLLASPAFGATLIKHTVCPSGCDYGSLDNAITHIETIHSDFDAGDNYHEVEISGDWTGAPDTEAVTISGLTQSTSARYLHIYTTGAARHDGIYGNKASAYRLEVSAARGIDATSVRYLRIEGLQIQVTSTAAGGSDYGIAIAQNGAGVAENRIFSNVIKGVFSGASTFNGCIILYAADADVKTIYVYNNIIYDCVNGASSSHAGIYSDDDGSTGMAVTAYNNTIHNSYFGIWEDGASHTISSYNNGFASCNTAKQGTVGGGTGDNTSTPTFVNEAGDDFHLAAGDTTWKDAGDGATPKAVFTNDIDGQSRPAADGDWDVGADEVISTATKRIILVN